MVSVMVTGSFFVSTEKSKVSDLPLLVLKELNALPLPLRKPFYLPSLTSCVENGTMGIFQEVSFYS